MPDGQATRGTRGPVCTAISRRPATPEHRYVGRSRERAREPQPAWQGSGFADFRIADGLEGTRPARLDAGDLARRIWTHADFAARHGPRSQSGRHEYLDGRSWN